jgi:D-alanyl-D-alanine carboxypeptidase
MTNQGGIVNATLQKIVRRGDAVTSAPTYRAGRGAMWGAAALIGAMLADLAETVLDPASSGEAAPIYDAAVQQHGRLILCGYLLLVSALLVFPGVYGLTRGVTGRGRRFANAAIVVSFLGALGHAALGGAYLMWAALPGASSSRSEMIAVLDRIMGSAAVAPLGIGFIAFPVGILLVFAALLRAGAAPRWVLAPVLAAPVAAIVTPGPDYLSTTLALVFLLVAAVAVTLRIGRGISAPDRPDLRGPVGAAVARATATMAVALALLALVGAGSAAASTGDRGRGASPELRAALDQLVQAGVPGAIVLVRDANGTVRLTSGYAEATKKTPIRVGDRFRIGSLTKSFVSAVVLQLAAEGRLSLDDSVDQWLPGLVPNGQAITIRQLLNMKAGLYDYPEDTRVESDFTNGNWAHRWKPEQLVRIAVSHKPLFAPGKGWSYCNTCYVVAGLIVEKATGNTIGQELERRVFTPLGLRHTTFDTERQIAGRHVHGYVRDGARLLDTTLLTPSWAWAAGAIVSTVDDVARFYRALFEGRLVGPRQLAEMKATVAAYSKTERYGLGLARFGAPCGPLWGNGGDFVGFNSSAYGRADSSTQFVLFANLDEMSFTPRVQQALDRIYLAAHCGAKR